MLLTGLLPFGCIFVQLFFIFNSIWGQQLFFMFGFLFLVFVFFLACIIEITILKTNGEKWDLRDPPVAEIQRKRQ